VAVSPPSEKTSIPTFQPETSQQGSAYSLTGDKAYQGFLALWKDADPDIPILKEAKAEYAKLK
jgi:hypothetical protein